MSGCIAIVGQQHASTVSIGKEEFCTCRDNVSELVENCRRRNSNADPQLVAQLYTDYVALEQQVDAVRKERNDNAASMKVRHRLAAGTLIVCTAHGCACPWLCIGHVSYSVTFPVMAFMPPYPDTETAD